MCTGLGSGLDFFSFVIFSFVSSVLTCFNFIATLSLSFVDLFFSEIILDICELILSLLGICVEMQCDDAINCVLASPSLLPFRGHQVQGNSILKKNCVREMTVEVRFFSHCPVCYLWNSRDFPYNRSECNVDSIPLE